MKKHFLLTVFIIERDLENVFSAPGISLKNIRLNEMTILQTLKAYLQKGWKLLSNTPLTMSPSANHYAVFMSRYLLTKDQ